VAPFAAGATTITLTDVSGLVNGQEIALGQFAAGTVITGISGNVVTLSAPAVTALAASTNTTFQSPSNNATFGSASSAAGIVNLTTAQNGRRLTLNPAGSGNYTFTGAALTLAGTRDGGILANSSATFNNAVNSGAGGAFISFGAAGQTLTFNGGGSLVNTNITVTNQAFRNTSTVVLTGPGTTTNYSGGAGATWNIGDRVAQTGGVQITGANVTASPGSLQIGNSGNGFASVKGGAALSTGSQASIGRASNAGTLLVENGTFRANSTASTETLVHVGRENGTGLLDVRTGGRVEIIGNGVFTNSGGGVLGLNTSNTTAGSTNTGTLDISGGTVVVKDLRLNTGNRYESPVSTAGRSIVNLSGTGSLYIGGTVVDSPLGSTPAFSNVQGGISNRGTGASTYEINLSGGTLGANAAWTSNVNMSLVSGNTTVKTANEGNVGQAITLSGVLSGAGALTKTGNETLTLNSSTANTFTGGTTISEGTLVAATAGSMGLGNVSLTSGLFTSQSASAIADTATLLFTPSATPTVTLTYAGSDVVGAITNGTLSIGPGTYTTTQLNNFFGGGAFTGTGSLTIVPEPTSAALLGLGLVSFCFVRKRRTV
jgi:fibronectin-binding autotransporter adhesin